MPQQFAIPVLGASGSVSAVIASSAALYPGRIISLIIIQVRLLHLFLAFTLLDMLWLIANMANQGDGKANAVHLAGALSGWIAVGGFQRVRGPWSRFSDKRVQDKRIKSDAKKVQEEERMDQILAKISREGMPSLSNAEKQFLNRQSKKKSQ